MEWFEGLRKLKKVKKKKWTGIGKIGGPNKRFYVPLLFVLNNQLRKVHII